MLLGWSVSTFHGQPLHSHGGGVLGMTTHLMLLPREYLSVFVSNNLMSGCTQTDRLRHRRAVPDMSGDIDETGPDWIGIVDDLMQQRWDSGAEVVAKAMAEAERDKNSSPSLPLDAYAGTYRVPWYGEITLTLKDDGRLWFRSPRSEPLTGPLEHFQHDTFIVRWQERPLDADAYMTFTLTPEGEVEGARMKAVSPTTDLQLRFSSPRSAASAKPRIARDPSRLDVRPCGPCWPPWRRPGLLGRSYPTRPQCFRPGHRAGHRHGAVQLRHRAQAIARVRGGLDLPGAAGHSDAAVQGRSQARTGRDPGDAAAVRPGRARDPLGALLASGFCRWANTPQSWPVCSVPPTSAAP